MRRLGSTIDMQRIPDLENSPESQLQFIDHGSAVLKPKMNRQAGSYLLVTGWLDVDAHNQGQAHEPTQELLCLLETDGATTGRMLPEKTGRQREGRD